MNIFVCASDKELRKEYIQIPDRFAFRLMMFEEKNEFFLNIYFTDKNKEDLCHYKFHTFCNDQKRLKELVATFREGYIIEDLTEMFSYHIKKVFQSCTGNTAVLDMDIIGTDLAESVNSLI